MRKRRTAKIPVVRFNLDCYNLQTNTCLIFAVFRYNGKRLKYSTGEKIKKNHWDDKRQRAKNIAKQDYNDLNERLNEIQSQILEIYKDHDLGQIQPKEFKRLLDVKQGLIIDENRAPTFFEFVPKYIQKRKTAANAKIGTVKNFTGHFQHLVGYAEKHGQFDFEDVDWNLRNKLIEDLYQKGIHPNTVNKIFQSLKMFMNAAKREGLHDNSVYNEHGYNVKKAPTNKPVFYRDELEVLANLDLSHKPNLERVRDHFLIGCYTMLRFSDFSNICPEHIKTFNKTKLIEITQQKTGDVVALPLWPELDSILNKYNYKIEKISIQKFNQHLKEIARLAGFTDSINWIEFEKGKQVIKQYPRYKKVSSHMARRSGATNYYLDGWPASMLMKLTGHKTETQFFGYINIGNRSTAKYMIERGNEKLISRANLKAI